MAQLTLLAWWLVLLCWCCHTESEVLKVHRRGGRLKSIKAKHDNVDDQMRTLSAENPKRHPILFVPGLGGSQLWAKLTGKQPTLWYCSEKTHDYYSLWLSLSQLVTPFINCCIDNLRLHYDASSHSTYNTAGVDIMVPHFGDTRGVEWINPLIQHLDKTIKEKKLGSAEAEVAGVNKVALEKALGDSEQAVQWLSNNVSRDRELKNSHADVGNGFFDLADAALRFSKLKDMALFADMADYLVAKGYKRGEDLRAAPYDFRKAPNEMGAYYSATRRLIEETYAKNGNSPVVVVAHSMGNPVMLHFYNHEVSTSWKDKYIRAHAAIAAPWAGSVKSLKLMISGDALGIKWVEATKLREVQRSMVSTAFLLPRPQWWGGQDTLVTTASRNYSTSDYPDLFRDMGFPIGYQMWTDVKDINNGLPFPEVDMHCVYGVGVKTMGRMVYENGAFPDKEPRIEMDDGDGTINLRSLRAYLPWLKVNTTKVIKTLTLPKVNHIDILKQEKVLSYVLQLATS